MNPEFQRNLWLETSPRRIAWAGVVLALIYGATAVVAGQNFGALAGVGLLVFAVAGFIWGPRVAGRSVGGEVAERTWDFQRLSALTPWGMTWGKLAGSASLSWLVGATGLALTVGHIAVNERNPAAAAAWLLAAVGLAVLLQAGAMALALVGVRRARAEGRLASLRLTPGTVLGILLVIWALQHVLPKSGMTGQGTAWLGIWGGQARWWGGIYPLPWFAAVSLAVFAGWAVAAAWRLMRLELQMQNAPWAWGGFVLFAGLYAAGLAPAMLTEQLAVAGAVFAACAYAGAFAEPADRVGLRLWASHLMRLDIPRLYMGVPAVIGPAKLAAIAAIGVALVPAPMGKLDAVDWKLTGLAAFAFLMRDLGVIAYFRFAPRPGRGDFGAVLGLFLLYFVGGVLGNAFLHDEGRAMFMPSLEHAPVSLASGLLQAAVGWTLAWTRLRGPEAKT